MKRNRVGTAKIASVGYNAQRAVLEIEFRMDGQVWQYYEVPEDIWYCFKNSAFTDLFYFNNISGRFVERLVYSKKQNIV